MTGRRAALHALGKAGLGALALASPLGRRLLGEDAWAQSCTVSPQQTEGPYYLDGMAARRNVIESRPGVALWLSLEVASSSGCSVIPGAEVEIWHADAGGAYSGFQAAQGETFMRGRQTVGAAGVATFRTVYPGWYTGRTPHIHVKVHVGGSTVHTGQLYFAEEISDAIYAQEPYATRGDRDTTNASDGIFGNGGASSMVTMVARGKGYWGKHTLVVAA